MTEDIIRSYFAFKKIPEEDTLVFIECDEHHYTMIFRSKTGWQKIHDYNEIRPIWIDFDNAGGFDEPKFPFDNVITIKGFIPVKLLKYNYIIVNEIDNNDE